MTDQRSMWQRSTTRRFVKWLFSWRTARRFLIGVASLVTLWALFCTEENLRGKRAWEKYRRELEARGEQLDWNAFIPKPVPDEQNFAATPVIQSWFVRWTAPRKYWHQEDNYGLAEVNVADAQPKGDWGNRHFLDLSAWGTAFDAIRAGTFSKRQKIEAGKLDLESRAKAAPAVLNGIKTNEPMFAELRAASQRPYCRYPIQYDAPDPTSILLPHLNSIRYLCRRLQLKACAELAAGQNEKALEDMKLMFRLVDSLKEEPFLISYLVRIACLGITIQPIWEGLAEHAWSDAQLQELQARLQRDDFVADLKRPLDAERAAGLAIIDFVKISGKLEQTGMITSLPAGLANLISRIVPSGWYYQEQLNYCRLYQIQLTGAFHEATKRVSPNQMAANFRTFDQEFSGGRAGSFIHHRFMAALLLSALNQVIVKAAAAQTVVDQAALACALERYRLANGQFPEKLDALVPRFISQSSNDVITGESYKYRRTDDGQFILYSVGWNEKDDGGVPGKALFDEKKGDWVWQYPAR